MDFDSKSKSKPALNYDIFRSWNVNQIHLEDESEFFLSPERSPQCYYKNLSPSSKTQAVARGHRELMDMVSQMPESFYELSLRDMVENPMVLGREEEEEIEIIKDKKDFNMRSQSRKSNKESRALIHRNKGVLENEGFYLKMGFPKSIRTTKNVKNSIAKVSPKPFVSGDKEWWKKRFSVRSESESVDSSISSRISIGSGSNINRKSGSTSRQVRCGCWSWI